MIGKLVVKEAFSLLVTALLLSWKPTVPCVQQQWTDYQKLCQLVQTSQYISCNGFMMVQPSDVKAETAHLDMLLANLTLCDKIFMGSAGSAQTARDSLAMARIVLAGS